MINISRVHILFFTFVWWIIFAVLSITRFNELQVLNIVGFIFLSFVPGFLTVLCLRLGKLSGFAILSLSVALSLLILMLLGLIGNYLLPMINIVAPLESEILLGELSLYILVISIVVWFRLSGWEFDGSKYFKKIFPSRLDVWFTLLPSVLIFQSIFGALRLNNGESGLPTILMLFEIAIFFLFLYFYANKLSENTIPFALFFVSAALLLMSSMRGWYITGHDIQQEYKVFELTKNASFWSMDFYRDAYNACLSITILPTTFFKLLSISDPYIYKFFFQFFFALAPGISYLIGRLFFEKRPSLLAGIIFAAFPTFINDMAFLVRQEIALLYYGLMIYIIFESKINFISRRTIFIILGVGAIVSHYSTTYTILLVFLVTALLRSIFLKIFIYLKTNNRILKNSSLDETTLVTGVKEVKISFINVFILVLLTLLWTMLVTNTGGHVIDVVRKTAHAVFDGLTENSRSTDATNLLSFKVQSQQEELESYVEKIVIPLRKNAEPGVYFPKSEFEVQNYVALKDVNQPLTKIGEFVQRSPVDIVKIVYFVGRLIKVVLEILTPIGFLYLMFKKYQLKSIDLEFYLIAASSLILILMIIVVPVLSTEYGILRAMQQSMFVLAIPTVVGARLIGRMFKELSLIPKYLSQKIFKIKILNIKSEADYFSIIFVIMFFLYSSTFIPQIFGQTPAMMYLSNSGRYYDNYLIKPREVAGAEWLTKIAGSNVQGKKIIIQTDTYSRKKLATLSSIDANNDIFPELLRKDAYVFLGQATVLYERATLVYNGDQVTYNYPLKFINEHKNLIYSNGTARIYR